jgi:hypothetical protein
MKTVDVTLYELKDTGYKDKTNRPITQEVPVVVKGCLYAPVSTEDVLNTLNLTGKTAVYQLAIPKGDANNWENATVEFLGQKWRTIGIPEEGIEGNIPLKWNRKVKVERYV